MDNPRMRGDEQAQGAIGGGPIGPRTTHAEQPEEGTADRSAEGLLKAGVASADLTIDDPAVKVNDPLLAKVLVLDDGETKVALIAIDVVAIGGIGDITDDFLPELRRRIEEKAGIPGGHVLVSATHTHPLSQMLCDSEQQIERTLAAVGRAAQGLTEVTMGVGHGHEDRIMMNRTLRLKNGRHWTIRHANPCPPDDEVEGVGPVDPEIGILRFDRLDGRPFAVVYNFACHPYIGVPSGGVTADFPGFASKVIEANLGHGAMALFLQGAGGDITEVLYKDVTRPRDSEPHGTMLGLSTLAALQGVRTAPGARIRVASETIDLPRRTDVPERIEALLEEQQELLDSLRGTSLNFKTFLPLYIQYALNPEYPSYYSYRYLQSEETGTHELSELDAGNRRNIDKYYRNIRAMEKLARIQDKIATLKRHKAINDESGEPTIKAEVQGIRIGDSVLISAPLEVLVEVGLNVKNASPFEHTFMAAFANGYMHYGPKAEDYDKGGYEVTECLLAPEWQAMYEKAAAAVISRL